MNRYEDTYWVIPTRLVREYRHGRLLAADLLLMAMLLNLPFSYFRHKDLRHWWGVSKARWFAVLSRLEQMGMISIRPGLKRGWSHLTILPPWRLPKPIREQWGEMFPNRCLPRAHRVMRQYYDRLRWEFDQELKELSRSELDRDESTPNDI